MLQRHRLVWLNEAGWREAGQAAWDARALELLVLWAQRDLPLVVTRQRDPARLALGLPAPLSFERRRLVIEAHHGSVSRCGEFPPAASITVVTPNTTDTSARDEHARSAWPALCDVLARSACDARVYGGHGWQALTGLQYVHAASDVDLLLPVAHARAADAVCALLADFDALNSGVPRLDGELILPDGAGIAWREWLQWRRGQAGQLLVKRIAGAALERPTESALAAAC